MSPPAGSQQIVAYRTQDLTAALAVRVEHDLVRRPRMGGCGVRRRNRDRRQRAEHRVVALRRADRGVRRECYAFNMPTIYVQHSAVTETGHFLEHRRGLVLAHVRLLHHDGFGRVVRFVIERCAQSPAGHCARHHQGRAVPQRRRRRSRLLGRSGVQAPQQLSGSTSGGNISARARLTGYRGGKRSRRRGFSGGADSGEPYERSKLQEERGRHPRGARPLGLSADNGLPSTCRPCRPCRRGHRRPSRHPSCLPESR